MTKIYLMSKMSRLNQTGAIQFIVLILLLLGIGATVWLITSGPLKLLPKAAPSLPSTPEESFTLELERTTTSPFPDEANPQSIAPNSQFRVDIYARSDVDFANLFAAKLRFPANLLSVDRIERREGQSFVTSWTESVYDNNAGTVSIVGGVPNPGIKTTASTNSLLASVIFSTKSTSTNANITFADNSAIYSNASNLNILTKKDGLTVNIQTPPSPSPSPAANAVSCSLISLTGGILGRNAANEEVYNITPATTVRLGASYTPTSGTTIFWIAPTLGNLTDNLDGTASWTAPSVTQTQNLTVNATAANNGRTANCPQLKLAINPVSQPSPSPAASASPVNLRRDGNINSDSRFDLADMSALLSQFQRAGDIANVVTEADLAPVPSGDGKVNVLDVLRLRTILIEKGVISGDASGQGSTTSPAGLTGPGVGIQPVQATLTTTRNDEANVSVVAITSSGGLAGWLVDVKYNSQVLRVTNCTVNASNSVEQMCADARTADDRLNCQRALANVVGPTGGLAMCNQAYGSDTIRLLGVSTGLHGSINLGTITFIARDTAQGGQSSNLTIDPSTFDFSHLNSTTRTGQTAGGIITVTAP